MKTVNVELGDRSYPIHIGPGLLGQPDFLMPHIAGSQVCIVTNKTVAPLYLDKVRTSLQGLQISEIVLPDGEQYKTLEQVTGIYDYLLAQRFERSGTLLALGGGVVGDMTGFAAATYQRGVHFIQIPTTLLSQVDSSVGGKTGVNRPRGKNMVGAFYQPRCVIADTQTLRTLPRRELLAGIAEVIKYGLINNADFFQWISEHFRSLLELDDEIISHAIEVSCEEKARIVAEDEKESGKRAILNFGHTFGHAIETCAGYGKWLHGEAVAAGMVMAADLSMRQGLITQEDAQAVKKLISATGLPVAPPEEMGAETFLELMSRDKKAAGGRIRFVLLEHIGRAVVTGDVAEEHLLATLNAGPGLTLA